MFLIQLFNVVNGQILKNNQAIRSHWKREKAVNGIFNRTKEFSTLGHKFILFPSFNVFPSGMKI